MIALGADNKQLILGIFKKTIIPYLYSISTKSTQILILLNQSDWYWVLHNASTHHAPSNPLPARLTRGRVVATRAVAGSGGGARGGRAERSRRALPQPRHAPPLGFRGAEKVPTQVVRGAEKRRFVLVFRVPRAEIRSLSAAEREAAGFRHVPLRKAWRLSGERLREIRWSVPLLPSPV